MKYTAEDYEELIEPTIPDLLNAAAMTYEERGRKYGETYLRVGEVMKLLFPEPMTIESGLGYNRFICLSMVVTKLVRYCNSAQMGPGDHDSLTDLSVYAQMLRTLDSKLKRKLEVRNKQIELEREQLAKRKLEKAKQGVRPSFEEFKSINETKRKRGRPKKVVGALASEQPKRKRGRPRKVAK